jgi:transcriptional regulator with XRE-family HTH domain
MRVGERVSKAHFSAFGAQLRQLRLEREWSLSEVARRLGISKAQLALVEQGKRRLRLPLLQQLLRLYGTSLGELLSCFCAPVRSAVGSVAWSGVDLLQFSAEPQLRGCLLRLLRPVAHAQQAEWLELYLLPARQLPLQGYFAFAAAVHGVVAQGTLLVELPGDELRVHSGESFRLEPQVAHRYRNYTAEPVRALLIVECAAV